METKLKYIIFNQPHKNSGNNAGAIVKLPARVADHWLDLDICEETTYEAYVKHVAMVQGKTAHDYKGEKKKETKASAVSTKAAKNMRAIDELDLEANPELAESGLKVGDEVEVDEDGNILIEDKPKKSKAKSNKKK